MWVFGNDELDQINHHSWFGIVELPHGTPVNVFGHFRKLADSRRIYAEKFPEVAALPDFDAHSMEIFDFLNNPSGKFRFITDLRHNPVFMANEFKRLMFIARDVYHNGQFHLPCSYWAGGEINSHPGNHLSFAMQLMHLPFRTLMTVPHDLVSQFDRKYLPKVIRRFHHVEDMDEYFTGEYLAWIQDGEIEFPAVTLLGEGEWTIISAVGFLEWPTISRTDQWAMEQWWWDVLPKVFDNPDKIHDYVEVNTDAEYDKLMGLFVGFVLNSDRCQEDDNFKLKNEYSTTPYENYIEAALPPIQQVNYFANKHTIGSENFLK